LLLAYLLTVDYHHSSSLVQLNLSSNNGI